jgi:EAL domain-containing protein (putative c-di-GMP-specific phosphodiesterase class I)
MFTDMNYAVLYEGIEDGVDEDLASRMYARYLQGYKYSKPIPIEDLTNFFVKENGN